MLKNVFYINLDERKDRKELVEAELNKMGWEYERFPAIKHEIGAYGCSLSHLACLEQAKERGLDYVVIVEDDILFTQPEWYKIKLKEVINTDYDVFLIGGNIRNGVKKVNKKKPCLYQINKAFTTTGYIVKKHYYDTLIKNFRDGTEAFKYGKKMVNNINIYAIDIFWMSLQQKDKWYIIMPRTVTQRDDYSNIEERQVSYSHVMLDL